MNEDYLGSIKNILFEKITCIVIEKSYSQIELTKILKISQLKVYRLLCHYECYFSVEKLLRFIILLGYKYKIEIRESNDN